MMDGANLLTFTLSGLPFSLNKLIVEVNKNILKLKLNIQRVNEILEHFYSGDLNIEEFDIG